MSTDQPEWSQPDEQQGSESQSARPIFQLIQPWVSLVARLILGGCFLVAGLLKITDLHQSVIAVAAYDFPISYDMETFLGYALPIVEILLGLVILIGLFTRLSALLGGLLQLAYIGIIISVWARGMSIDCGCFTPGGILDDDQKTQYVEDIVRDTGFLLCAAWLVVFPKSRVSLDSWLRPPIDETEVNGG